MQDFALYNITVDNQEIIVRFNKDIIDQDTLSKFLDYLELETIRREFREKVPMKRQLCSNTLGVKALIPPSPPF